MDASFEEDEEVFIYVRDPYKRIDILPSSRHIKVVVDGNAVADTKRPRLLFETGLPTCYYMPKPDVRMDLSERSDEVSRWSYKGDWSPNTEALCHCFGERADVNLETLARLAKTKIKAELHVSLEYLPGRLVLQTE